MEKLIIKNSRWKYVVMLLGCIGFVAAGIVMIIVGEGFGWLSVLFFGAGIPIFIWQIIDARPRLVIDEHGVLDRTLGVGRIDWSDIASAYGITISGNDFICLELRSPEKYLNRLSKVRRAMTAANRKLGFTEFNLNLSGVAARSDEVFELVMRFCESSRSNATRPPHAPDPNDGRGRYYPRG